MLHYRYLDIIEPTIGVFIRRGQNPISIIFIWIFIWMLKNCESMSGSDINESLQSVLQSVWQSDSDDDRESWKSAKLLVDELFQCCTSDGLSKECIHEIIERHKLTPQHNNQVSNYQFFRMACCNANATEGIIQYLLEYFPDAANDADDKGLLPLHHAFNSDDVSLGVIQLLIDTAPDSVHRKEKIGNMPLHYLCNMSALEEIKSLEILHLLLERCPESIRHKNDGGALPIHIAAERKSPKFLSVLIEAYPGSERMTGPKKMLPLHFACRIGTVAAVEYLYNLYPDAIHNAVSGVLYPIHFAMMCSRVDLVKFLLGCDPSVKFQEYGEKSLLLTACLEFCHTEANDTNIGATVEMIEVIYDAHPEFIRKKDAEGNLPLHIVCFEKKFDGRRACEILKLLLKKYPESIYHANNKGNLPIHFAALSKSPELCQLLIKAYPGSERMSSDDGMLPIHYACRGNRVATVEYLYNLYPDGSDHTNTEGSYPIHIAINSMIDRGGIMLLDNLLFHSTVDRAAGQEDAVDIVKFLLGCDERVKLQKEGRLSLLAWACFQEYDHANIGSALEMIQAIFDTHPEAIESDEMDASMEELISYEQVREFINYVRGFCLLARGSPHLATPFDNGQLLLHTVLQCNVRLGSIKLLVGGYPPAVQSPDAKGALPLHIACAHHESATVVQYLIELDAATLEAVDKENNTALHYACLGAEYETITLLLEKYGAISVSKRNVHEQLPVDVLLESNVDIDKESVEYTGSIFQLLKAYPETVMSWM